MSKKRNKYRNTGRQKKAAERSGMDGQKMNGTIASDENISRGEAAGRGKDTNRQATTGWRSDSSQKETELLLEQALDRADPEQLEEVCRVDAGEQLSEKSIEHMAWSVIDKAELYDEEERLRRERFQRKLFRKRLRNTGIGLGIAAVLLALLYFAGVFDAFMPKRYDYWVASRYIRAGQYFQALEGQRTTYNVLTEVIGGEEKNRVKPVIPQTKLKPWEIYLDEKGSMAYRVYGAGEVPKDFPKVDAEMVDHTVQESLSAFCRENGLVMDDYRIKDQALLEQMCRTEERNKNGNGIACYKSECYVGEDPFYNSEGFGKQNDAEGSVAASGELDLENEPTIQKAVITRGGKGYLLLVPYLATCMDPNSSDHGETWRYNNNMPTIAANMCVIESTIAIRLSD